MRHSRKFCVSEFRQSQELWTTDGTVRLTSLVCRTPGERRGMRALGVNAAAAGREHSGAGQWRVCHAGKDPARNSGSTHQGL